MSASHNSPSPVAGVDWKSLPLDPREGFVLSRVDGRQSPHDISLTTGIPEPEVLKILGRLAQLGAIQFAGARSESPAPVSPRTVPSTSQSGLRQAIQMTEPTTPVGVTPIAAPLRPRAPNSLGSADTIPAPPLEQPRAPAQPHSDQQPRADKQPRADEPDLEAIRPEFLPFLEEAGDLDRATRIRILKLERRLESISHYELLKVARDADKKAIKNGYFTLVNEFHTDRFFGKNLGTFKTRLEKIFAAATKAEGTLTKAKSRAEYDKYLSSRSATQDVRESLRPSSPESSGESPNVVVNIPKAPRAPAWTALEEAHHEHAGDSSTGVFESAPADSAPVQTPMPETRRPDAEAARRLLAKKFGFRGRGDDSPPEQQAPTADPEEIKKYVAEQMKVRFEARQTGSAQIQTLIESARQAYSQKAYGPALNSLRMALAIDAESAEAHLLYREIQEVADRELADQFAEQAKYEENDGHDARACRSYERAARGKRSAALFAKAAECGLKARIDKRKVVELARSAVTLEGTNAGYRIILAKAYDFAGMRTSAVGEAQRAVEIDSKNTEAKSLLKSLK